MTLLLHRRLVLSGDLPFSLLFAVAPPLSALWRRWPPAKRFERFVEFLESAPSMGDHVSTVIPYVEEPCVPVVNKCSR